MTTNEKPPGCESRAATGDGTMHDCANVNGAVGRIRSILGDDVVLLGWSRGVKGEKKPWKHLRVEHMTPPYLAGLQNKNIGVALGSKSGGLCSIDVDDDAQASEFLSLNPGLEQTLISKGKRGCNAWVRVQGVCPPLTKLTRNGADWGEWRADGGQTIIHGRHPSGCDYRFVHEAKPITIRFEDIVWPEGVVISDEQPKKPEAKPDDPLGGLVQKYGQPFQTEKAVITAINQRFWGGVMMTENRILHEPMEREFYRYNVDRGLWQPVTTDDLVEQTCARLFRYRTEAKDSNVERHITFAKIKPIVELLRGMAERRDAFEQKPHVIHVANGVIRFNGEGSVFEDFSPEFYSRNQSPISFDPAAECPRFKAELLEAALDEYDVLLLQRWAGVALYGVNLPQRILILEGMPNGGKSTVAKILSGLVGIENCYQLRTDCLQERFETYRYRGKTLLMGADVPGDFLQHRGASVLKSLVGGDLIACEGKCSNGDFHVHGSFNVIITSNSRLRARLEGDADAWRRRLMIVRYEKPPPQKRILDFDRLLLKEEGAGILRWALDGFKAALEEFNTTGDIVLTREQRARVDGLLAESDSIVHFLQTAVARGDDTDSITSAELSQAYSEFCADMGWNAMPITTITREFDDHMLRLFHTVKANSIPRAGKSCRGWRRVRFTNHERVD